MRAASLIMWPCRLSAMNGSATSMATKIARILGTKASVSAWIWVSAWNSEMTTPTMSPISISGLETITSVRIASRATSSTSAPVMAQHPLSSPRKRGPSKRGPDGYASSLQQRPRSTGSPLSRGRRKGRSPSDRHPHDLFVGLDHAVAHGDERLDRHLRLRHRRDHIDDVGLARHHRTLLGIRSLAGLEHAADRILEERAEAGTLGFTERLTETRRRIGDAGKAGIGIGGGGWCCHGSCPDQAWRMSSGRWIRRRVT